MKFEKAMKEAEQKLEAGELKEARERLRGDIESAEELMQNFKEGIENFDAQQVRALRAVIAEIFEVNTDYIAGSKE